LPLDSQHAGQFAENEVTKMLTDCVVFVRSGLMRTANAAVLSTYNSIMKNRCILMFDILK